MGKEGHIHGRKVTKEIAMKSGNQWSHMLSFQRFMKLYHFKEFRHYLTLVCASETLQRTNDPWW
jgi:hypothetical protein